jgi:hypothetical protein
MMVMGDVTPYGLEDGPPGWGLGMRLTTSLCKNKFVDNILKNPGRGQGSYLGCGVIDDDDDGGLED